MYSKEVIIKNKTGIHARPATLFIKKASSFKSNIVLEKDGKSVNCKSLINVLSMGLVKNSKVKILAEGLDEEKAVNELVEMIDNKFGEKE